MTWSPAKIHIFFVSSRNGTVRVAQSCIKHEEKLVRPRKLLISVADFGSFASCNALTFSGLGPMPAAENTNPKKST